MIFGFLGLLCWALVVAHLAAKRVYAVVVGAAHGRPSRAAAVAAGLQLGGLLAFGLCCLAGFALARHFDAAWHAAFAVVPGCLLYTPLLVLALPGAGGYRHVRGDLGDAGAGPRVARAAAWAGGPVAFLGMIAVLSALVVTFDT
ncbi:hypothetical protein [Actinoplanes sp. NPDC049599]|uniref:hypothetical protein n=1 Tax=Actinoplanes sp. NPDC049599 TaxID=3363903 RepID=UPI0037B92F76